MLHDSHSLNHKVQISFSFFSQAKNSLLFISILLTPCVLVLSPIQWLILKDKRRKPLLLYCPQSLSFIEISIGGEVGGRVAALQAHFRSAHSGNRFLRLVNMHHNPQTCCLWHTGIALLKSDTAFWMLCFSYRPQCKDYCHTHTHTHNTPYH